MTATKQVFTLWVPQRTSLGEADMAGPQSTGVDETLVNRIKQVLMDSKDEIYKVHVDKPTSGHLGDSASARGLETLMNVATERINSTLSETNQALVMFVDGLDEAARAIKDADDQAAADLRKQMYEAENLIKKPFFENLAKDKRLNLPDVQLPFFPLSTEALEEIASRSEYGQDQEG
ncbi:hypothetical protein ACIA03_03685 [Nocardioides sp. NPDC051685]|uniref:hypothetical protein n=1 Tax=Nocardioides sp. NPDC051685 TaxID=3364334 RepID=UPI003796E35D